MQIESCNKAIIKFLLVIGLVVSISSCEKVIYTSNIPKGEWALVLKDGIIFKQYSYDNSPLHLYFDNEFVIFFDNPSNEITDKCYYTYSDGVGQVYKEPYDPEDPDTEGIYKFYLRNDSLFFDIPMYIFFRIRSTSIIEFPYINSTNQ